MEWYYETYKTYQAPEKTFPVHIYETCRKGIIIKKKGMKQFRLPVVISRDA